MGDYSTYVRTLELQTTERYRWALKQIVNHLGPEPIDCASKNHCEGCQAEMHAALQIAKEALKEK